MKTYQVHFDQVNQQWIEVEASSKQAAINKAEKLWKKINEQCANGVKLPSGKEESIYD